MKQERKLKMKEKHAHDGRMFVNLRFHFLDFSTHDF